VRQLGFWQFVAIFHDNAVTTCLGLRHLVSNLEMGLLSRVPVINGYSEVVILGFEKNYHS